VIHILKSHPPETEYRYIGLYIGECTVFATKKQKWLISGTENTQTARRLFSGYVILHAHFVFIPHTYIQHALSCLRLMNISTESKTNKNKQKRLRTRNISEVSEQFPLQERRLIVGRFDHEGLHQLHLRFVADEDLCGGNVLLSTSFFATWIAQIPQRKSAAVAWASTTSSTRTNSSMVHYKRFSAWGIGQSHTAL